MYFDNVLVPKENLIGPLNGGFALLMRVQAGGPTGPAVAYKTVVTPAG